MERVTSEEMHQELVTFPAGRVCVEEGCGTQLSIYNPAMRCSVHIGVRDQKFPLAPGQVRSRIRLREPI